jgi:hypothetical protein
MTVDAANIPQRHRHSRPRSVVAEQGRLDEQLRRLWAMSPSERVAAMRRGELSMRQCCAWSARHPDQVPLLNGEFEFIAAYTPEAAEAAE